MERGLQFFWVEDFVLKTESILLVFLMILPTTLVSLGCAVGEDPIERVLFMDSALTGSRNEAQIPYTKSDRTDRVQSLKEVIHRETESNSELRDATVTLANDISHLELQYLPSNSTVVVRIKLSYEYEALVFTGELKRDSETGKYKASGLVDLNIPEYVVDVTCETSKCQGEAQIDFLSMMSGDVLPVVPILYRESEVQVRAKLVDVSWDEFKQSFWSLSSDYFASLVAMHADFKDYVSPDKLEGLRDKEIQSKLGKDSEVRALLDMQKRKRIKPSVERYNSQPAVLKEFVVPFGPSKWTVLLKHPTSVGFVSVSGEYVKTNNTVSPVSFSKSRVFGSVKDAWLSGNTEDGDFIVSLNWHRDRENMPKKGMVHFFVDKNATERISQDATDSEIDLSIDEFNVDPYLSVSESNKITKRSHGDFDHPEVRYWINYFGTSEKIDDPRILQRTGHLHQQSINGNLDALKGLYENLPRYWPRIKKYFSGHNYVWESKNQKAWLPEDYIAVAFVESPFFRVAQDPSNEKGLVQSSAGALGPWQIMPRTACGEVKSMNLVEVFNTSFPVAGCNSGKYLGGQATTTNDFRVDYVKSTIFATSYLRKLYRLFDETWGYSEVGNHSLDPKLVLAAYNTGAGTVNEGFREVTRTLINEEGLEIDQGTDEENRTAEKAINARAFKYPGSVYRLMQISRVVPDYWTLHRYNLAPRETLSYVPKILAAQYLMRQHGFVQVEE
jgi:hypothetical protein